MSEQRSVGLLILHHVLFIPRAIISFFCGVSLRTLLRDEDRTDDDPTSFCDFLLCVISKNVIRNWAVFIVIVLSVSGLPGLENLMPENLGLAEGVIVLCAMVLWCLVQATLNYSEKRKRTQDRPSPEDSNQSAGEGGSAAEKTALEKKMWDVAETAYTTAFYSMIFLVALWLCIFSFDHKNNKYWGRKYLFVCAYIMTVKYILPALVFMMAALPYCPVNAVTIILDHFLHKKTMKNKLQVRRSAACETMGYITEILCNKTGIVTTNQQHVAEVFIAGKYYEMPQLNQIPPNTMALLLLGIGVNCSYTSYIVHAEERGGISQQFGNKTECALLSFAKDLGGDYRSIRCQIPEKDLFKVYPFTQEKKSMSTVLTKNGSYKMFSKGDCETLLQKCNAYLSSNGTVKDFNTQSKEVLVRTVVEPMKSKGLKTLCLAYKDFSSAEEPDWNNEDQIIHGLTLICVVGIEDPVKPEVPEAIRRCQKAGITVRIVTGENLHTAKAVALKCGIITSSEDICLEGSWLSERNSDSSQETRFQICPKLKVIAMASSKDRLNLIEAKGAPGSQKRVIAVVGHGLTDAEALKRADVGILMGMTGSEEAREASDIVLMEDCFSDIVLAVLWGRNVRVAGSKIVQYFVTAFTVALLTLFTGVFISKDSVLNTIDLFWIAIILALVPTALANDPPCEALLNRRPYNMDEPLLSVEMVRDIIGHVAYQIICIVLCRLLLSRPGNTIASNMYVLLQIFNMFNVSTLGTHANSVRGLHKNPILLCCAITILSVQVIIVQFGVLFYHHVPLSLQEWLFCAVLSFCSLIWQQLLVHIPTKRLKALGLRPVDFPQWEADEEEN